jgi:hypothetical protein
METICRIFVDDGILCTTNKLVINNIIMHLKIVF